MTRLPRPLKLVAYLFVTSGLYAAATVLVALARGGVYVHFGVVAIFAGVGLLRLRPWAWNLARLLAAFDLFMSVAAAAVFLFRSGELRLFGVDLGPAPPGLGFASGAAWAALAWWQIGVLTSRRVYVLFADR